MKTLNDFIRQYVSSHGITIQYLVEALGYKSKTSVDRILSGNAGADALAAFQSRFVCVMHATDEERDELSHLINCSVYGVDRANAFIELHDMLAHSMVNDFNDFAIKIRDSSASLSEYIKHHNIKRIKIYNCAYKPFFNVIRLLLRDREVIIEHYISAIDSEQSLIRVLSGVMDLMVYPQYKAYLYEADCSSIDVKMQPRGVMDSDLLVFEDAASNQCACLVPDNMQSGHIIHLSGEQIPLPPFEYYKPCNRTCPAAKSMDDFLDYCKLLSDMELNCATYDLKSDICVKYILFPILYSAFATSPLPQEFHTEEVLHAVRVIFEKRVDNMLSKKKPTYSIMSLPALKEFARTGISSDHMPGMRAFTVEERISIFDRLLSACNDNPWFEVYIRKEDHSLDDYNISCFAGRGFFIALKDSKYLTAHSPEIILTPPASFYKLFETYYREELIRNHCYTASESRDMIAGIINDLQGIG